MKEVLFIHGGGERGYEADAPLAASLKERLGVNYKFRYSKMPDDAYTPDFGWGQKMGGEINTTRGELFLVGHSLGASMVLKYLSESEIKGQLRGLFLLATPFWRGDKDWQLGLMLPSKFPTLLPKNVPIFLYHCEDDEENSISNLAIYEGKLPQAIVRRLPVGGHQFAHDLSVVARDIHSLR